MAGRRILTATCLSPATGQDCISFERGPLRLIWISVCCAMLVVALLLLGEAPLPLFGGDHDLAARIYKMLFMVLITGIMVGLAPAMFAWIARFGRARMAGMRHPPAFLPRAKQLFDTAGRWMAGMIALGGLGSAVNIWLTT